MGSMFPQPKTNERIARLWVPICIVAPCWGHLAAPAGCRLLRHHFSKFSQWSGGWRLSKIKKKFSKTKRNNFFKVHASWKAGFDFISNSGKFWKILYFHLVYALNTNKIVVFFKIFQIFDSFSNEYGIIAIFWQFAWYSFTEC